MSTVRIDNYGAIVWLNHNDCRHRVDDKPAVIWLSGPQEEQDSNNSISFDRDESMLKIFDRFLVFGLEDGRFFPAMLDQSLVRDAVENAYAMEDIFIAEQKKQSTKQN